MIRTLISSSSLKTIGYDYQLKILEVEFRDSSVYQYYGVPQELYQGLMNAESHGKYYVHFIRGHFQYKRIFELRLSH